MASRPPSSRTGARPSAAAGLVAAASAALAGDLPSRRWFGDKARAIAGVVPLDHAALPGTAGVVALFRVEFAEGPPETYCVPVMPAPGDGADRPHADALDDPAFCAALAEQIRLGAVLKGRHGRFRFTPTAALSVILPGAPHAVTPVLGEQSNSSVVFDNR